MNSFNLAMGLAIKVLLAITVFNVACFMYQVQSQRSSMTCHGHDLCGYDGKPAELPGRLQDVAMTFEKNDLYSLVNDKAWVSRNIVGARGFLRLGQHGRSFATSFIHQMHCINALRFSYTTARDGVIVDPDVLASKITHDNHCFQFLRQTILCRADNSRIPVIHNISLAEAGFGVMHRCRDWVDFQEFVIQNDAKWEGKEYYMDGESLTGRKL